MVIDVRAFAQKARKHPLLLPFKRILKPQPKVPKKGADISLMDAPAKVRYKMAHDRRPILTQWADKVAVREYVSEKIGSGFLTTLYLATRDANEIHIADLPREFAFKPSHGSGAGIFVHESADPSNVLPLEVSKLTWKDKFHIHPDSLDESALRRIGQRWLSMRYENNNQWFEWVYSTIEARLILEEYLTDRDGNPPVNYLIYTYHGTPAYIVVWNVFTAYIALVSPQWEHLDVKSKKWPLASRENMPSKPENLDQMLEVASKLSNGIDFVRVDLYNDGQKITFSEMTNYPGAGRSPAYSLEFDREVSVHWKSFDGY
jgi:hypothetical protein